MDSRSSRPSNDDAAARQDPKGERILERLGLHGVCAAPPERHGRFARLRLVGGLDIWCRAWGARWGVVVRQGEQGVKHVYPSLDAAEPHLERAYAQAVHATQGVQQPVQPVQTLVAAEAL